jgi:hypothetical protein
MSNTNPVQVAGGIVANSLLFIVMREAITACAINRKIEDPVMDNLISSDINRNLSTVE